MKKITTRITNGSGGGLYHDSRGDVRIIIKMLNIIINKINEIVEEINSQKEASND